MITKEDIPCIRDKCILYPICKFKSELRCDILKEYADGVYDKLVIDETAYIITKEVLSTLRQVFPNIEGVYKDLITRSMLINKKEREDNS